MLDHGRVAAQGSPAELKARIGGERIEVTVGGAGELAAAATALGHFASDRPAVDVDAARVVAPVATGVALVEVVRALDAAGVDAIDLHRREATLDDVFLAITDSDADGRGGRRLMSAYAERLRFGLSDSLVLARRNLSHIRQIPEKLLDVTVQPLMFVLLFAYVFGGAIAIPGGGNYHEYLIGRDPHPDADLRDHGAGHVDRDRPRRGHPRPLPLAADGALGLPDRPRARGASRRRCWASP